MPKKRTVKETAADRLYWMLTDLYNTGWDYAEEYERMTDAQKKQYRRREEEVYEAAVAIMQPFRDRLDRLRAAHKDDE